MDRSFTVEAAYNTNGNKLRFHGGRYISKTPSSAARKAFTQMTRHKKGKVALLIHIRETTMNSHHKTFVYKVTRKREDNEVERDGETILYKYVTKVKAM